MTAMLQRHLGKPRPVLVIGSDHFLDLPSVTVCPLTTSMRADIQVVRLLLEPSAANGLRERSQVAIDKITTIPNAQIGGTIGRLDDGQMARVAQALAVYLAIV